mmetsp:Transcript_41359/g.124857  ORF Transcript_41359/g.124857 Transcript_41359/m.124857 type:complete len:297 (-) Transcript_41359:782-1672(-)
MPSRTDMRSFISRWAVSMPFSCGSFFVPVSSGTVLRVRPSGVSSWYFTRYFLLAPVPVTMRSSTMSTTRTRHLCLEASIMSRAEPVLTSSTNSVNVLDTPTPNCVGSMAWSWRVVRTASFSSRSESLLGTAFSRMSRSLDSLHFCLSHHSYFLFVSVPSSWFSKPSSSSLTEVFMFDLPSFACSRRATSSRRRSLTPAFAPASRTVGRNSSFSFISCSAADTVLLRNSCSTASAAAKRFSSSRSRQPNRKELHSVPQRVGTLTGFVRTSSSPLKGKRPETRPKTVTPSAHTSALSE